MPEGGVVGQYIDRCITLKSNVMATIPSSQDWIEFASLPTV